MSEMEKQELINRIGGMSTEEKQLAVTAMPLEILLGEVSRRCIVADEMRCEMENIIKRR